MPLEPILGLKRAAVLLLELPQLVVDIKGAAEVRLPQPLAKLRQVAKAVEELLATLLEGLVLCHGGHRSLRRDCYGTTSQRRLRGGVAAQHRLACLGKVKKEHLPARKKLLADYQARPCAMLVIELRSNSHFVWGVFFLSRIGTCRGFFFLSRLG